MGMCEASHNCFQVRFNNSFFLSLWSEPLVLPRNASVTDNCTLNATSPEQVTTPNSIPSHTGDQPRSTGTIHVPFWAYIIIGVGGLLLAVLLCGTPLLIFLCRNYRRKKELKDMLKVLELLAIITSVILLQAEFRWELYIVSLTNRVFLCTP